MEKVEEKHLSDNKSLYNQAVHMRQIRRYNAAVLRSVSRIQSRCLPVSMLYIQVSPPPMLSYVTLLSLPHKHHHTQRHPSLGGHRCWQ